MSLIRSVLFLPASNGRAIEKARTLDCDVAVLDLEDAVAPEMKIDARETAGRALIEGGFGAATAIRVNALDTPWVDDDLKVAARAGIVVAPKVSTADEIRRLRDRIGPSPRLWIMVETARALVELPALGAALTETGGGGLILGVNDLVLQLGCRMDRGRDTLRPHLAAVVAAARAYGLDVIDGVFNDMADRAGLSAECDQGRRYGFDGKSLIHPAQIEVANRAFAPSPEEMKAARRVVEAFAAPEAEGQGVLRLDGRMVERLHLAEAQRLLDRARRIAARAVHAP